MIDDCNAALRIQKDYNKALNRRATASEKLGGDGGSGAVDDPKMKHLVQAATGEWTAARKMISALTRSPLTHST